MVHLAWIDHQIKRLAGILESVYQLHCIGQMDVSIGSAVHEEKSTFEIFGSSRSFISFESIKTSPGLFHCNSPPFIFGYLGDPSPFIAPSSRLRSRA